MSRIDVWQRNSEVLDGENYFFLFGFLFKIRILVPSYREN